jgi:hypothetical protein
MLGDAAMLCEGDAVIVLSPRALNRATLARQLLLERADRPVLSAVADLGGLQAQEPQAPFVGLWSRLRAFDPHELSNQLSERRLVRTRLMRGTVHLVTAEDALAWRARHDAMLRQRLLSAYRRELTGVDLDELTAFGWTLLADGRAQSMAELGRTLTQRWPAASARALAEVLIAGLIPMVQPPPRGLWRTSGAALNLPLTRWLGRELAPPVTEATAGTDPAGEAIVRRYLTAFGPAALADIRAWSALSGLPAAVAAIREELVTFRDDRGRELFDFPDAPRPDPDTPAPVRFLPVFDNAILGYDDRSRIIDAADRGLSVAGERVVLVDGRVAATWKVVDGVVTTAVLRRLTRAERSAVAEEGRALTAFLSGDESYR